MSRRQERAVKYAVAGYLLGYFLDDLIALLMPYRDSIAALVASYFTADKVPATRHDPPEWRDDFECDAEPMPAEPVATWSAWENVAARHDPPEWREWDGAEPPYSGTKSQALKHFSLYFHPANYGLTWELRPVGAAPA